MAVLHDAPDTETICGLGNKKDKLFNEIIISKGVEVYESSIKLIQELRDNEIRVGVATSSKNCVTVLNAINLLDVF